MSLLSGTHRISVEYSSRVSRILHFHVFKDLSINDDRENLRMLREYCLL